MTAQNLFGEPYTPGLHPNAIDLTGKKIGRLTVVRLAGAANDNTTKDTRRAA